jgi:hypothetical protein
MAGPALRVFDGKPATKEPASRRAQELLPPRSYTVGVISLSADKGDSMPNFHIKLPTKASTRSQSPSFGLNGCSTYAYNGSALRKFPQEIDVELALERNDEFRQPLDRDPPPSRKLGMFGRDIDIGVHP